VPDHPLVVAARSVDPVVRAHADQAEAERRLPSPVVDALVSAGLTRMCVPAVYAGPEADPMTMVEAIAAVAGADGSAGWCAMIASTTSSMASLLEPEFARQVYADPHIVTGGTFAPNGRGERVDGGHVVSGRWQWGSGTSHCQWILGGARTDSGEFHLMYAPADDVELVDTWYSSGLRGTGSGEFRFASVFVPDGHSLQPFAPHRYVDVPLARFPIFNLLAAGVAATTLGIARRAVDELVALALGKTPQFSSRSLAESALAQLDLARAEAALGAARAFLLDELDRSWQLVVAGSPVDESRRARVRIAAAHAAAESARAVDLAYHLGGGSSVFTDCPLQRCFRDVHTATQHLMVQPRVMEAAGKVLLGVDVDTSML
jgi:alkylation response protein AidB-like acyl-CoA dehydrogenase